MNRRISLKKLTDFTSGSFWGEEERFFSFVVLEGYHYNAGTTGRFSNHISLPIELGSLEQVNLMLLPAATWSVSYPVSQ